jgi:hypothetical protein
MMLGMLKGKSATTVPFREEIAEGYYGFRVPTAPAGTISPEVNYIVERGLTLFRTLDKHRGENAEADSKA